MTTETPTRRANRTMLFEITDDQLLPRGLEALVEFKVTNAVYAAAVRWHNNPASSALSDGCVNAAQVQVQYHRALEQRRKAVDGGYAGAVEDNLTDLLAAITVKLEREAP